MRVVVADAAAHVRSALHLLLDQHAATCVAELASGAGLLAELERAGADVLIVDAQIPDVDLASLLPTLSQTYPNLLIVVLSSRPEERERALAGGADAFVCKGDAPERLVAILSLTNG
jgi:DNA-binding NarL/FixJ family response regulator